MNAIESKDQEIRSKFDIYAYDFYRCCTEKMYIRNKERQLVKFIPNNIQRKFARVVLEAFFDGRSVMAIVLKARQMGISTVVAALYYWITAVFYDGMDTTAFIVSHNEPSVAHLLNMYRRFHDYMDPDIKAMSDLNNKATFVLDNPNDSDRLNNPGRRSEIKVQSAASASVGSSDTINLAHISELSKWERVDPKIALTSLLQAVPDKNSIVIIESTANGAGDYFNNLWDSAVDGTLDALPIFFAWYEFEEYTKPFESDGARNKFLKKLPNWMREIMEFYELTVEQMHWYHSIFHSLKIRSDRKTMNQEYPSCPEESFVATGQCYFDTDALTHYLRNQPTPLWTGEYSYREEKSGHVAVPVAKEDGRVKIYEYPVPGEEYVMGVDVAEGMEISSESKDRSSIHILNKKTLATAAHFNGYIMPEDLAKLCSALGEYYFNCYIGIEANMHGRHTIIELRERCNYPLEMIHKHQYYDKDTNEETERLGWWTSGATKGPLINHLADLIRHRQFPYMEPGTVGECMKYIEKNGKLHAQSGCFDDRVISKAIAAYMIQSHYESIKNDWKPPKGVDEFNKGSYTFG